LPSLRLRVISMLAALAILPPLILSEVWASDQLASLRERPAVLALALILGLAAMAGLAAAILRRPALFPLLAVAALPFRIPVEAGGATTFLLIPLYLVIGAGVLAYAWERLRPEPTAGRALAPGERRPAALELALLGFLILYVVQAMYSSDFPTAVKNVAFFYVPFALLLRLLSGVRWSGRLALGCLLVAVGLALAFVALGFWEYATRHLLWNPKVIAFNELKPFFRVNSLFFDPNIYGRFLAMTMAGLAGALLWSRSLRSFALAAATLALLWAGLLLTFSQSSFAALLGALAVLAALRWSPRIALTGLVGVAVAGLVVVVAAPGVLKLDVESGGSIDAATSGRWELVRGGVGMFADRPLWGFGSGSFAQRFRERERVSGERAASASHTTPITVAAEQGLVGLVAYLVVLAAAFRLLFAGLRPLRGPPPRAVALVACGVVAAQFSAQVLHTWLYAAFLEDPMTWTLLAIAVGLRAGGAVAGRPAAAGQGRVGVEPFRRPLATATGLRASPAPRARWRDLVRKAVAAGLR
jgi:O-antigen ligase